jgi:hypothetical protein
MRPAQLALLAALLAALLPGCAPQGPSIEEPAAREWPADTVLAVEDLPISAAEVDAASVWVERIDRRATPDHLRRLALTNVVLPAKIARLLAPEARAKAQAEASAALELLRSGTWVGPPGPDGELGQRVEGDFRLLGIPVWGTATDLEPGAWSDPIELPGCFVVVRRLALSSAVVPIALELAVDQLTFPYLDPENAASQVEAAYDRFRLTVVDPAWRVLVPELLQYRMGVHG